MISTTRLFQAVSVLSNDVFVNNEQRVLAEELFKLVFVQNAYSTESVKMLTQDFCELVRGEDSLQGAAHKIKEALDSRLSKAHSSNQDLPKLSWKDAEAGRQGTSSYYSKKSRYSFGEFHRNGAAWNKQAHIELFKEGLLQYYVAKIIGFDFGFNYQAYSESLAPYYHVTIQVFETIMECFGVDLKALPVDQIKDPQWLKETVRKTKFFSDLMEVVRRDERLLQFGGDFQLLKVETEQLRKQFDTESCNSPQERENLRKQVLHHEIRTNLQQQAIVSWIQDLKEQLKAFIKGKSLEELESRTSEFRLALPLFFENSKYAILLEPIKRLYPVQEGGDSCPHCVAPVFQQKQHNHNITITYV